MHNLEPYYNWRGLYCAEEDERSPFFAKEYSEFEFSNKIYDHFIHPQWDSIGSQTLFVKLIFANYTEGYAIVELIGEWNDLLYNDIMFLKREFADHLINEGITKFIFIGENVLNFHTSDDCYYEEWFEDVNDGDGWIALVNFRDHVLEDFSKAYIDQYFVSGGSLNEVNWRTQHPHQFYDKISASVMKRIG